MLIDYPLIFGLPAIEMKSIKVSSSLVFMMGVFSPTVVINVATYLLIQMSGFIDRTLSHISQAAGVDMNT